MSGNFYPAKLVSPHLFVGSKQDGQDPAFWKKHDIRLIVNCTKDIPFVAPREIKTYRVPVDDSAYDADLMAKYIPIAVLLIHDTIRYGHNVLVCCYAGMNRSATVAAAYLMFAQGLTAKQAMSKIKARKSECFSPMNFKAALDEWETKLRRTGHIPNGANAPITRRRKTRRELAPIDASTNLAYSNLR